MPTATSEDGEPNTLCRQRRAILRLERRLKLTSREVPGREQTQRRTADQRKHKCESKHGPIDAGTGRPRQLRRHERHQDIEARVSQL